MKNRIAARYKYQTLRVIDSAIESYHRSEFCAAIKLANEAEFMFQRFARGDLFERLRDARNNKKYIKYIDILDSKPSKFSIKTLKSEAIVVIEFEIANFFKHYDSSSPLMATFLRETRNGG